MTNYYKAFPTLEAKAIRLERDLKQLGEKKKGIKENPRFATNEAEREFQLDELQKEREGTLAEAEESFQVELQVIELHLAEQAFTMPEASAEATNEANTLADSILLQLKTNVDREGTLSLLKLRINTMSDTEKQTVKLKLVNEGISLDDDILKGLNDTAHMRSITEQLEALNRIKKGGDSLRRQYDSVDKALASINYESWQDIHLKGGD